MLPKLESQVVFRLVEEGIMEEVFQIGKKRRKNKTRICFCFICHFYPPFTRKRVVSLYFGREVRTRLGVAFFEVYGPPVFHIKAGASR